MTEPGFETASVRLCDEKTRPFERLQRWCAVQLLERHYGSTLDERAGQWMSYALSGLDEMTTLVEGLLTYSRAGGPGSVEETVDTVAVVEEVLRVLQRSVSDASARITIDNLPAVSGDPNLEDEWTRQVEASQAAYVRSVEGLMERYSWVTDKVHRRKMAREAARSVLPNATEVKIVASGNARAWRTMLELRCGEGAELEIRRLAVACLRLLQREAGSLFSDFEIYVADDRQEAARVAYHKV